MIKQNILAQSNTFSSWTRGNVTPTSGQADPGGGTTAWKLAATATVGGTICNATVNGGAAIGSRQVTYTIYAKGGTGGTVGGTFFIYNNTTSVGIASLVMNWDTGTYTASGASCVATAKPIGGGWYKIELRVFGLNPAHVITVYAGWIGSAATIGDYIYVWRSSVVQANYDPEYVETGASLYNPFGPPPDRVLPQNLIINSMRVGGTHWGVTSTVGVNTLTPDYAMGPDGVAGSAARVQLDAGSIYNQIWPNDASPVPNPGSPRYQTFSAWLRATGSSAKMRFRQSLVAGVSNQWSPDVTLDATWRRYAFTALVTGATNAIVISNDAAAEACDFLIWGPQLEHSNVAGEYIATPTDKAFDCGAPRSRILPQNLLVQSVDLAQAAWSKPTSTAPLVGLAPDGGACNVFTDTVDGAPTYHYAYQSAGVVGRRYTFAVFVKAGSKNYINLFTGNGPAANYTFFDIVNGVAGSSRSDIGTVDARITSCASWGASWAGWFLCERTFIQATGALAGFTVSNSNVLGGDNYQGVGAGTLLVWRPCLYEGTPARIYTPTTATAYDLGAPRVSINP